MKNKSNLYSKYQKYVKDKDLSVKNYIDEALLKTKSMFKYNGLPDSLPYFELEKILQTNGYGFIIKHDGELICLKGGLGGQLDVYDNPTKITVANPALNINDTFDIKQDGVLMLNDSQKRGLLPVLGKYAVLLTDTNISLNTVAILSRITLLISASDDKTKESADKFVNDILNGDFSIIGENTFFDGVNVQSSTHSQTGQITPLIELLQYYKSGLLSEIGLNSNFNMKRERLTNNEVNLNTDSLLPSINNMLEERRRAVNTLNSKYGTDIKVQLSELWSNKLPKEAKDEVKDEAKDEAKDDNQ